MPFHHQRAEAGYSAEVETTADEFWRVLRDWSAVMEWIHRPTNPALLDVTLKDGHSVDRLPCTRVAIFREGSGFPPSIEETLLHADPEARRIYYRIDDIEAMGVRNYFATTTVDGIPGGRALVSCKSSYDVREGHAPEIARAAFESIYEHSVVRGMEAAARRRRGGG